MVVEQLGNFWYTLERITVGKKEMDDDKRNFTLTE